MQYPIIDNLIYAYQRNGWTGLEVIESKNLYNDTDEFTATWATRNDTIRDFLNTLDPGDYTISYNNRVDEVFSSFTSETAYATTGRFRINADIRYGVDGTQITREQALNGYDDRYSFVFTKNENVNVASVFMYSLGRDSATTGAPSGALGSGILYNIQIEKGTEATPYEPYAPPTTDIKNRLKLPMIHYFPHPVIDAIISAADGQHTEEEKEILRHYLTPLGIGGI